ncbi:CBS domain-containing protein [Kocuria soli]|nr:hypothetical protein [Kocuria soli]
MTTSSEGASTRISSAHSNRERTTARPTSAPCHLDMAATAAAARLLNGAGSAVVVCHDGERGYTLDTALHGAAADGSRYLVAAPTEDAWPEMPVGRPQRVAMTIKADAPLPEVRMNTSQLSGHVMLTRCSEDEELAVLSEGPLPTEIARALACWPDAQLWHVEPLKMTVHHVHGSHSLDHEALRPRAAWPSPVEELEAIEALRCRWGTHLTEIVPALRAASSLTAAFPDAPGDAHCATGRAYPVAVTDRDLSFLVTDGTGRETVVVPLERPARSVEDLVEGLHEVVASASRAI